MDREEILKELNYQGEYKKEVRKKMRQLLKKYHPDNNKTDDNTILLLYDIKRELENGELTNYSSVEERVIVPEEEKVSFSFLGKMIKKLELKKKNIDIKIEKLYKTINDYYSNHNKLQDEVNNIQFMIDEILSELNELKNVDNYDMGMMILIIILSFCMFLTRYWVIGLVVCILFFIEIYYIYLRNMQYEEKKSELIVIKKKFKKMQKEFTNLKDEIHKLYKEEIKLKNERLHISNDLQFYNYEMSKLYDQSNVEEKEYGKEVKNSYKKK